MDTSLENSVRCLLRFGFPPDFDRAEAYLRELLEPAAALPPQGKRPMHELLEEIVGEIVERSGTDRIVIPLTAGLDSRAILGATLRCVPKERILCVTFGRETDRDVIGARTVCATLGLEWNWTDVAVIPWSVEEVRCGVLTTHQHFGSYAAQTVVRLLHIQRLLGPNSIYLSGYLGGLTGTVLRDETDRPSWAVVRLLSSNSTFTDSIAYDVESLCANLEAFAKRWKKRMKGFRSFSCYEALHLGFRQALRIRGAVAPFQRVALPLEDPRWVRYWYDQRRFHRLRQRRYIQDMRTAYPEVFCLQGDSAPVPPLRYRGLRTIARQQFLRPEPVAAVLRRKAGGGERDAPSDFRDFEVNPSCQQTYAAMLAALDSRGILPEVNFSERLAGFTERPSRRNLDYITHGVRAEAHLRAGTLTGIAADR